MRQVSIKDIKPGERLATNVRSSGKVLFRQGHKLSKSDILMLRRKGVRSLHLLDDEDQQRERREGTIRPETREKVVEGIREIYINYEQATPKTLQIFRDLSKEIVTDIMDADSLKVHLHELRSFDDYTFRHSVNVTAISTAMARLLGWKEETLRQLASGGLMHDIGKMRVPTEILVKDGPLEPREKRIMRLHPDYGYKLMVDRVGGTPHEWVVVHQHHETLDGGGYPKGKRDREIHEFSRVVAVADMYDALRSDRPYKKGWSAHKVMTFLNSEEMRDKLDSTALATLNRIVICFPVGSTVKLNDGRLAKVVSNRDDDPLQPTVATLPDPETGQGGGETLDLASDPRLAITDLLE